MAKKKKKDVTDFLRTGPRLLPSRMGRSKTSLSKSEQFWLTENAMNEIKNGQGEGHNRGLFGWSKVCKKIGGIMSYMAIAGIASSMIGSGRSAALEHEKDMERKKKEKKKKRKEQAKTKRQEALEDEKKNPFRIPPITGAGYGNQR